MPNPTPSEIATPEDLSDFHRDVANLRGKLTTDFVLSITDAGPINHDPDAMTEHEIRIGRRVVTTIWHPRSGKVSELLARAAIKIDQVERQQSHGRGDFIDLKRGEITER